MDTAKRVVPPIPFVLLICVAKLETSHVLHSNKNKTYRGCCIPLSVSIAITYLIGPFPASYSLSLQCSFNTVDGK